MNASFFSRNVDEELVQRARELRPLIASHAAKTESERQVVPEVIQALEEASLFEVLISKRYGGLGATMATQLAVAAELGAECVSTAWVQTLINITTWGATLSPVAEQIFAPSQPRPRYAGVFNPTGTACAVPGGYRVSGKWHYSSGSFHANWFSGASYIQDEEGNLTGVGMAMIPRKDFTIEDSWFVAGVEGSASNTVIAQDVFIPHNQLSPVVVDFDDTSVHPGEGNLRWPLGSALSVVLLGSMLGAARACADIVVANAPKRAMVYTSFTAITESSVAVTDTARALLDIDTAWMHAFEVAGYVDGVAAGNSRDLLLEARLRGQCGYTLEKLREGVDRLINVAGAGSFSKFNVLQRHWRDINVGSRHAFLLTNVSLETYGRKLFGQAPIVMIV